MTKHLSARDIATALGISRRASYRLVQSLPRVRIGRCVRVSEHDLKKYIATHKLAPKVQP